MKLYIFYLLGICTLGRLSFKIIFVNLQSQNDY